MRSLHIIMPLGGLGTRFSTNGYKIPKPLIDVNGIPMFLHAINSFKTLNCNKKYTFIVRYDHIVQFNILNEIKKYIPTANFVTLMSNTRGAVETCIKAEKYIDNTDGIIILDCDLEFYCKQYFDDIKSDLEIENPKIVGKLVSFDSTDPRYSYAKIDDNNIVLQTAEKNPISSHALTGSYYFSSKQIFINAANALITDFNNNNIKTKELYLSLLYNYIINNNGLVKLYKLEKYNSFGTPEELDLYLKKNIKINGHSRVFYRINNQE